MYSLAQINPERFSHMQPPTPPPRHLLTTPTEFMDLTRPKAVQWNTRKIEAPLEIDVTKEESMETHSWFKFKDDSDHNATRTRSATKGFPTRKSIRKTTGRTTKGGTLAKKPWKGK